MELSKLHDICRKYTGCAKEYYVHPIPERKVTGARESLNIPNSEQIVAYSTETGHSVHGKLDSRSVATRELFFTPDLLV